MTQDALSPEPAQAVTLYATGFEDPPFTLGNLAGQDGWAVFGPATVLVQNTVVQSGAQAVSVNGSVASQSGPFHSDFSTGPLLNLSADINLSSSSTQSGWQFSGVGPGLVQYLGGINVLTNGDIQLQTLGFPIIGTFSRDVWHHIEVLFNLTTQTYDVTLDSTTIASDVPFCGANAGCNGAFVPAYGTGFFDTFGGGNDIGYLDNFSLETVTSQPIPEPSTYLLLATGLLGMIGYGWRKRRA